MKVINTEDLKSENQIVSCPDGGFISHRYLLAKDGMGFSLTRTIIAKGDPQIWHYKNHLEACYCVSGKGKLGNMKTGEEFDIVPGTLYALDQHDKHMFMAIEDTELICVFNPPLKGKEVHDKDRSYKL